METDKTPERSGLFIGRMRDLGLGNPDGIPSVLAHEPEEQLQKMACEDARRLVDAETMETLACIDGRHTIKNADGTAPVLRLRRVGGSASNLGVALNGGLDSSTLFGSSATLGDMIVKADMLAGFDRSAHEGGCGGANGEIADHEAIHARDEILKATRALMDIPAVKEYLGVGYEEHLAEKVRANAAKTAELLRSLGWDGQAYVDGVRVHNPHGVEILAIDPKDHKFHGHRESKLDIIVGKKTSAADNEFVWNLEASKVAAQRLAQGQGDKGYAQMLIAEIAKHMAVANRLASPETPIELLAA